MTTLTAPVPRAEAAFDEEEATDALAKDIFSTYQCRSVALAHAQPHPGDIAEPASLSAIPLPHTDYPITDSIPLNLIKSGKLSQLQLESVLHAATKHLTILPSGERCGFFIGDSTGVGKGRQVAGIIIDSYVRGRKKHVWVSTSTDLYNDAVRDFRDLGCHIPILDNLQALDKVKVTPTEGVLFVTYSTLTSSYKGKSRLQQLINWLGGPASFDGVITFDEAHKAKRFSSNENAGTKVAAAVVELQKQLPMARIVYCSATGVSEVGNMAYMSRLALWGPGSAFNSFDDFVASMKTKGVTFLEQLAMEMKYDGLYVARGLSFHSAEFMEMECPLNPAQIETYNAASKVWTSLRSSLAQAVNLTQTSKDVWKPFWGAQQRFFKMLCVSMKIHAAVKEVEESLAAGFSVVIGIQSTGESAVDSLKIKPGDGCSNFISVAKETLLQFVENHFPVVQEQPKEQQQMPPPPAGVVIDGTAVQLKNEIIAKINALNLPPNFLDELIDKLGGPSKVAEMTGRKARVVRDIKTGRLSYELRQKSESSGSDLDSLNIKEQNAFMDGKKLVAIVSDAASTGISLHASAVRKNQLRRMHLTLELPWAADKAIQQLGRTHRSNQASAPLYKLAFTDLGGERRFAAAVARRLQSLGALTRGDRRAASGLDMASLNFDSPQGRTALKKLYNTLVLESPTMPSGVTLDQLLDAIPAEDAEQYQPQPDADGRISAFALIQAITKLHKELRNYVDIMGVGIGPTPRNDTVAEDQTNASGNNGSGKDLGDVRRFLNRLLGAPVARQKILFAYFQLMLAAELTEARKNGHVEGVSDLPGQQISRQGPPQTLWVDDATGLKTIIHHLSVDRGVSYASACDKLEHERAYNDKSGFYVSRKPAPGTGRHLIMLALQKPTIASAFSIVRPNTGPSYFEMDIEDLKAKYLLCDPQKVADLWNEAYETSYNQCTHGPNCQQGPSCSVGQRLMPVTILAGSIVRIWDVLERVLRRHEHELNKSDRMMRIVRVELPKNDGYNTNGLPLIGVRFPGNLLPEVVVTLSSMKNIADGVAAGTVASTSSIVQQRRVEPVAPVDAKALKKAFQAPQTIMSMFAKKSTSSMAVDSSSNDNSRKRAATDDDKLVSNGLTAAAVKKQASGSMMSAGMVSTKTETVNLVESDDDDEEDAMVGVQVAGPVADMNVSEKENALMGMGFSRKQAAKALQVAEGNVERAANWLLAGSA